MICSITVGIALLLNFTFFARKAKTLNLQKPRDSYLGTRVKRFWQPWQPVCFSALIPQALHSGTFTDISCLVLSLCFGSLFCWKVHNSRRTWALRTRFLLSSPSIPPSLSNRPVPAAATMFQQRPGFLYSMNHYQNVPTLSAVRPFVDVCLSQW